MPFSQIQLQKKNIGNLSSGLLFLQIFKFFNIGPAALKRLALDRPC